MEKLLITTVIPTFKRPRLLERALSSVCSQTMPHFQVCVYDNASNDGTEAVVKEFLKKDSRVQYHCHPQNIGMMNNYQYALSRITTPFFSILSDDDLLFPWFYETTMRGFSQFPEAFFSASSAIIMSSEKKTLRVPLDLWKKEGFFQPPSALAEMISQYPVPTCIIFRREVLDLIPINTANLLVWDCDFLIQIASRFPIFTIKQPCGIFMQHPSSFSFSQNIKLWRVSFAKMKEKFIAHSSLPFFIKIKVGRLFGKEIKQMDRGAILVNLFHKNFKKALLYALRYKKYHGWSIKTFLFLITTRACLFFSPTLYLLIFLRGIKRLFKKKLFPPQNLAAYDHYAKWL